mgnify:CR=1 FL=1
MTARALELLAPAKDLETGRTAIDCGADAVYIGARAFGARASAGNSTADIAALAEYAHRFGARVYVTLNTIVEESELEQARTLAMELVEAGVDAFIVQDMAYTRMGIPIALHASTQCDIRTPRKAKLLAAAGFTQLVLPREFTPREIREVAEVAGVPVEVFIHGARCVSYSGDCQMGYAATGRSANRGMCPQMCRLPFDLTDAAGHPLGPRRHYLSLSDLKTADLGALADAGASSFKIEGRLKDRRYVANVVAWYSARLDEVVAASGGRYVRSSHGKSEPGFTPDIEKGFFRRPNGGGTQACLASPNDTGVEVGRVAAANASRARSFKIKGHAALVNGDGLGYFEPSTGQFLGFRLNRAEGAECYPAQPLSGLKPGIALYRTYDKQFTDALDAARPRRTLLVDFALEPAECGFTLSASAENGVEAKVEVTGAFETAVKPQQSARRNLLAKLGNTDYRLGDIDDRLGDVFVPASLLAEKRREVLQSLSAAVQAGHKALAPGRCTLAADAYAGEAPLSYHDNVANSLAEKFYTDHGATVAQKAAECGDPDKCTGHQVMTTKYCLRRELGACLRTADADKYPRPLFLRNESGTYRLDFDCSRCGMNIIKI